jgi:hypothetical protein
LYNFGLRKMSVKGTRLRELLNKYQLKKILMRKLLSII